MKHSFLASLIACSLTCSATAASAEGSATLASAHTTSGSASTSASVVTVSAVSSVTVITDVFGDGQKVAAVALEYPKAFDSTGITPAAFSVEGKTIARAYTNYMPTVSNKLDGEAGRYVILEFEQKNTVPMTMQAKPRPASETGTSGDAPRRSSRQLPDLSVRITQTSSLTAVDGTTYEANETVLTETTQAPSIIDRFETLSYTNPATGHTMPYNIFLPDNYDPSGSYPLLFFVSDASANIDNDRTPLFQGTGAVIFAKDRDQRMHEAIVLAPQYTQQMVDTLGMMTTDSHEWSDGLVLITGLLNHVIDTYPIDRDRIYGTGQSQGGMTNIAISDRYPNLFAAQYLVACQWDTDEMKVLKDKNLWILVSEGDTKAFPAMNTATAEWESLGTKVARDEFWDSTLGSDDLDALARKTLEQNAAINYSVFRGGSHNYTWTVAYDIPVIRDWLFEHTLSGKPVSETASGKFFAKKEKERLSAESKARTRRDAFETGLQYFSAGDEDDKNYERARKYFKRADKLGHFKAARYLGIMSERGLGQTGQPYKAFDYYKRAAMNGDITSQYELGRLYESGIGTSVDYAKAYTWYAKAAETKNLIGSVGLVGLAGLYLNGHGVVRDVEKATELYQAAADLGNTDAVEILRTISTKH